jgi:hypothetical protein
MSKITEKVAREGMCRFADDMVGYMYDELDPTKRVSFESHLAECSACIDEFALVAEARFSVYEWHKTDFVSLPTPAIVIPYHERKPVWSASLLGWIEAVFAVPRVPAFALAALLVATTGFVFFLSFGRGNEIATISSPENAGVAVPEIEVKAGDSALVSTSSTAPDVAPGPERAANQPTVPVISNMSSRPVSKSARAVETRRLVVVKSPNNARLAKKTKSLKEYGDEHDDSLRLADLLAEIGGERYD